MMLHALAAERCLLLSTGAPTAQRPQPAYSQSEPNPPAAAAVDRWDRQTDGQTDGRPTVT